MNRNVALPLHFLDRPDLCFLAAVAEFRGFHVRFRDVARGGVRLVQSRYQQAYSQNVVNLFDECYNLVQMHRVDGQQPGLEQLARFSHFNHIPAFAYDT